MLRNLSFSIVLRSYPYVPVPLSGPHFSEYLYFTVTEDCTVMLACKVTLGTNRFCPPSTSLELQSLCLLLRWQMWRRRHLSTGSKRMKRLFQKILPMSCQEPVLYPSPWYPYIPYYLETGGFWHNTRIFLFFFANIMELAKYTISQHGWTSWR